MFVRPPYVKNFVCFEKFFEIKLFLCLVLRSFLCFFFDYFSIISSINHQVNSVYFLKFCLEIRIYTNRSRYSSFRVIMPWHMYIERPFLPRVLDVCFLYLFCLCFLCGWGVWAAKWIILFSRLGEGYILFDDILLVCDVWS